MANKRVRDLTTNNTYNDDYYVEVDDAGFAEAQKMKLSVVVSDEAAARETQDDTIEAGCGLETDGTYATNELSNYIKAADFVAGGETESLKGADNLLDAKIKDIETILLGIGNITTRTVTVTHPIASGLFNAPFALLGDPNPLVDTEFSGYRIIVIDAWARIDYKAPAIDVGSDTLNLRYSNGTTIGTWTNAFYESTADGTQKCLLADNVNVPDISCIQLYCASNDTGSTLSDFYITIVYTLEAI